MRDANLASRPSIPVLPMSIERNPGHVITRMDDEPAISVIAGRAITSEPTLLTAIAGSAFSAIGG
jgi:hypothetical protein